MAYNQFNLPALDRAHQAKQANAFNMERAQVDAERADEDYNEATRTKNTRFLYGATKVLQDLYEKDPDQFYTAAEELGAEGIERGIIDPDQWDPQLVTIEQVQDMHNAAKVGLAGLPANSEMVNSKLPSRVQNAQYYSGLDPQGKEDFRNANAATKGMTTVKVPMPDGSEIMVNYDKESGQGFDLQTGQEMIVRPGNNGEAMVYGKDGLIGPGTPSQAPPGFGQSQSAAGKKTSELSVAREFDRELEVDSALTGLNKALRLKPVIQRAADTAGWNNTGFMSVFNFIPGLTGKNLESDIDTIKANLGFGELAEMRRTSKTGGAVGQLSDRELTVLSAVLRNLDTSQTYEQLHSNLGEVLLQYNKWANAYSKDIAEFGTRDQFAEYYEMLPVGELYYHPNTMERIPKQAR